MSNVDITLRSRSSCTAVHAASGATITTDVSPEYGGSGEYFSASDLLASALGVCIATSISPIAERHGVPLDALSVGVTRTLSTEPKRMQSLSVTVTSRVPVPRDVLQRWEHAAKTCVVKGSLHPDVEVTVVFDAPVSTSP